MNKDKLTDLLKKQSEEYKKINGKEFPEVLLEYAQIIIRDTNFGDKSIMTIDNSDKNDYFKIYIEPDFKLDYGFFFYSVLYLFTDPFRRICLVSEYGNRYNKVGLCEETALMEFLMINKEVLNVDLEKRLEKCRQKFDEID